MASKLHSIITDDMEHCLICGHYEVAIHHVFYGTANRKMSDQYALIVPLCERHHTGSEGVHRFRRTDLKLKQMGQQAFENHYGSREVFIRTFGRNYLD